MSRLSSFSVSPKRFGQEALRLSLSLLLIATITLGGSIPSFAHLDIDPPDFSFRPYHFNTNGDDTGPINLIFVGDLNTTLRRFDQIFPDARDPLLSGVMRFEDHNVIDDQDAERAVGSVLSRLHIRFEQGHDRDPVLGAYTLGSIHRDVIVATRECGINHKGVEFNEQRDRVARAFEASGHTVTYVNLGNNRPLRQCDGTFTTGDGRTAIIGPSAVDAYMLVDLSGSFADDLPVFKAQAPQIISTLRASHSNIRFGLGKYEDYPIPPFGDASAGDQAYERLVDLTFDTNSVLSAISGLFTRFGGDSPQSQLPALYQAATGAGQDLSGAGFPGASIPAGQQANFRDRATKIFLLWTDAPFHLPGDPGAIPYPGPSFAQTVDAILALDPPKVIGISSGPFGTSDLQAIAEATDAIAPAEGVDCNGDSVIDIESGQPLVCSISFSGEGVGEAIMALVDAAVVPVAADLSIAKVGQPNPVIAGQNMSYTLTATNHGPAMASNVILIDALPSGVRFTSATPSHGTCAEANGTVICNLGDLANGASATVTIIAVSIGGCSITNTSTVIANEPDPSVANNDTSVTTTVHLDNFNRANGGLGANWRGQISGYRIVGNSVSVRNGGYVFWQPATFGADQVACVTLTKLDTDSEHHTLMLKAKQRNTIGGGVILVSYSAALGKVTVETRNISTGGWNLVGEFTPPTPVVNGDRLSARAMADGKVQVYINDALVGTADAGSDYANVGGQIGLFFTDAYGAVLDDFGGGNVAP